MPGMMDTVLNLGMNDETVAVVASKWGERFAYDSYRRLLDMYADVVLKVDHADFEKEMAALKVEWQRIWTTFGCQIRTRCHIMHAT
jgi:pyruvate, orthophosphate dikinase